MKNEKWYGYIYLKNMRRQSAVKICVPRLVENLKLTLDVDGSHFLDNVDVCGVTLKPENRQMDLKLLLGILNSSLMRFVFPFVSAPFRGGWRSANRQFLSQLPIYDRDEPGRGASHRDALIIRLVTRILDLTADAESTKSETERTALERAIAETDRHIDAAVYELYGLDDSEIATVEMAKTGGAGTR